MNDDEKARFNAALDLVQWLDLRIAQQVEHQLEQRLARQREYLRCIVSDLVVEERERVNALLEKGHNNIIDLTQANHEKIFDRVQRILERSEKTITEVNAAVERTFDRLEARFGRYVPPIDRPDDDGQPPPSTH